VRKKNYYKIKNELKNYIFPFVVYSLIDEEALAWMRKAKNFEVEKNIWLELKIILWYGFLD